MSPGRDHADSLRATLEQGLDELGLDLPRDALAALELHAAELQRWRKRADLTSLVDPRLQAIRLYLDALTLCELVASGATVADLGTGAGFPGFPLAVARPDLSIKLVETRALKTTFLLHVLGRLFLDKVEVVEGRASRVAAAHGPVDLVVARAFAPPDRTRAEAAHWLEPGGQMLLMRGPSEEGEALGPDEPFELEAVHERTLPLEGTPRRILSYRKR